MNFWPKNKDQVRREGATARQSRLINIEYYEKN